MPAVYYCDRCRKEDASIYEAPGRRSPYWRGNLFLCDGCSDGLNRLITAFIDNRTREERSA